MDSDPSVTVAAKSDAQIEEIVRRLERRYTRQQISRADLEGRVREWYHRFNAARIRTFVPVFVERGVRRSVDEQAGRPVGALIA